MRAMVTTGHGGLDQLEFHDDWPVPQAAAGEVLIRIGACGCNNTDIPFTVIGSVQRRITHKPERASVIHYVTKCLKDH